MHNSRAFTRFDMWSTLHGAHSCTAAAVVKQPHSGGGVGAAGVCVCGGVNAFIQGLERKRPPVRRKRRLC